MVTNAVAFVLDAIFSIFILAALGVALSGVVLVPLGLAFFAAGHLL